LGRVGKRHDGAIVTKDVLVNEVTMRAKTYSLGDITMAQMMCIVDAKGLKDGVAYLLSKHKARH
jgi:hypothetical protein